MEKSSGNGDPSRDLQQSTTLGCGPDASATSITLNISTTTGGTFSVLVETQASVENLKKTIAKRLKVAKDRICLLHRERELQDGTLKDNGLIDGSKVILIPNVETGLLAQRPENTVMQALESLNDSQVNDFLSGKTPLNLSMRLGDHMMLIQLQLSTVNPSSPSHASRTKSSFKSKISTSSPNTSNLLAGCSSSNSTIPTTTTTTTATNNSPEIAVPSCSRTSRSNSIDLNSSGATKTLSTPNEISSVGATSVKKSDDTEHDIFNKELENIKTIMDTLANIPSDEEESDTNMEEMSPIKSLSNLVSSPIKTTPIKCIPISKFPASPSTATTSTTTSTPQQPYNGGGGASTSNSAICADPISAKLTSCLCKRLDANSNSNGCDTNCQLHQDRPSTSSSARYSSHSVASTSASTSSSSSEMKSVRSSLLHRTTNNPIIKSKHRHSSSGTYLRRSKSSDNIHQHTPSEDSSSSISSNSISASNNKCSTGTSTDSPPPQPDTIASTDTIIAGVSGTDTRALAEASRNLTQTLRKLSKEVFTNKVDVSDDSHRKSGGSGGGGGGGGSGAVIESMKNHGKGIYSGTFSGTLNPALQDRYGRPKRDISTVIHILNDLLSATPQYSRGARISFEPTTSRTMKSAHSRRQIAQKESCKCVSSQNSSSCTYGECNGHSASTEMIQGPFCDKHKPMMDESSLSQCSKKSPLQHQQKMDDASPDDSIMHSSDCQCQFRSFDPTSPEEGTSMNQQQTSSLIPTTSAAAAAAIATQSNQVCIKCSSIELENSKTKNKLEQLRLVMQQKKERREARKLRLAPYGGRLVGANTAQPGGLTSNGANTIATIASPNDVVAQSSTSPTSTTAQQPHIVEEVDTAA